MLYSLLLIACGSVGLVSAGYPHRASRIANTSIQPKTTTYHSSVAVSSQALHRRGDDSGRSTHSQPGRSSQSQSGPIRQSQTNQSSGRPPMPRFPSPSSRDGNTVDKGAYPRIALEAKGPAVIATKAGIGGVVQRYTVMAGPPHHAREEHPEKAMAAGVAHGTAPHAAGDQPYAQHALKMHAQGRTARLDIKVPRGGKGSYVHENAEGESGGSHIQSGRRVSVISASGSPHGAHIYGSVTRGGRIIAQATNVNTHLSPPRQRSPDTAARSPGEPPI